MASERRRLVERQLRNLRKVLRREIRRVSRSVRAKIGGYVRQMLREIARDYRLRNAGRIYRQRSPRDRYLLLVDVASRGRFFGIPVSEKARQYARRALRNRSLYLTLRERVEEEDKTPSQLDKKMRRLSRFMQKVAEELQELGYSGPVVEQARASAKVIDEIYRDWRERIRPYWMGVDVVTGESVFYDPDRKGYWIGDKFYPELVVELTMTFETRTGGEPIEVEATKVTRVREVDGRRLEEDIIPLMRSDIELYFSQEWGRGGEYIASNLRVKAVELVNPDTADRRYDAHIPLWPRNVILTEKSRLDRKKLTVKEKVRYTTYSVA